MTIETTKARVERTRDPIIGHGPFSVQVRLRGNPCGEYRHGTRKQAEAHAKDGRHKFEALGFAYRVVQNATAHLPGETINED